MYLTNEKVAVLGARRRHWLQPGCSRCFRPEPPIGSPCMTRWKVRSRGRPMRSITVRFREPK